MRFCVLSLFFSASAVREKTSENTRKELAMAVISELRPSPIAGTWYPGEAGRLTRQVDHYLDEARLPDLVGEVIGVIAPHAGYVYSGTTAGHAFRSVRGKSYPRVVVLSPFHGFHPASFITSAHQGYQTPLGPVWIDQDALSELEQGMQARGLVRLTRVARDSEHSLEIELPFLQRALTEEFQLVPVMVRSHDLQELQALGQALAETLKRFPALLVASSDLSHFYPLEVANRLDEYILAQVAEFSPEGVLQAEEQGSGFACGVGAVTAMLWAAQGAGAGTVRIIHHSTSADQTGDARSVVGYGAAVVLKSA
jgi:AmmeMemoRadiSam system protein B